MFGPTGCLTESALDGLTPGQAPVNWGIFPRVALALLQTSESKLQASAIEVYNNAAYDLLAERQPLHISASHRKQQRGIPVVRSKGACEGGEFSSTTVGSVLCHAPFVIIGRSALSVLLLAYA